LLKKLNRFYDPKEDHLDVKVIRVDNNKLGERSPQLGEEFPQVKEDNNKLGERLPQLGEEFPQMDGDEL
jgi:hypothetical protein